MATNSKLSDCFENSGLKKTCKLPNKFGIQCNQELFNVQSNLKRHLKRLHKDTYDALDETEKVKSRSATCGATPNKKILHVPMDRQDFENYLIGMVVQQKTPLSVFGGDVFRTAFGGIAAALGVSLERDNIRRLVSDRYELKKKELKKAITAKGVHIKLDGCSRHNIRYFGLNIQYCDGDQIKIKTLAMRSTEHHAHTSDYIKRFVEGVMREFGIAPVQVLSVVTDNASNMVAGVKKLGEELELDMVEIDCEFNTDNMFGTHMRCAAHSLQLAVKDALRAANCNAILDKARRLVIAARTPSVINLLKGLKKPMPIKDVPTRWGTVFQMLERLIELKETLVPLTDASLTEDEWKAIEVLKTSLVPTYKLGLDLQSKDLTPGSFFALWRGAMRHLDECGSALSLFLSDAMRRRGSVLFSNNVLLAGIYVDPNYRLALNPEQVRKGRETFINICVHLQKLKKEQHIRNTSSTEVVVELYSSSVDSSQDLFATTPPITSGTVVDFEDFLDREQRQLCGPDEVEKSAIVPYVCVMESFRRERIPVMDVINNYPCQLQEAARAVTALPPTQVSVERLFSSLKLVVTDSRSSLGPDLTESILFLGNNGYKV